MPVCGSTPEESLDRYLKWGVLDHGLVVGNASPLSSTSLQAYCDVDWTSDVR